MNAPTKNAYVAHMDLDEETLRTLKTGIKTAISRLRLLERDCVRNRDYAEAASLGQRIAKQERALDVLQEALDDIVTQKEMEIDGVEDPDAE